MSTAELATQNPNSDLAVVAGREKLELIRQTVARGCNDLELELFLYTAKRTGLDPLLKQIYAIKRWDSALNREAMTIQTGIDGFRVVANRTGKLAGMDDAVYDVEDAEHPNKATVTVWKIDETGERRAYTASARWSEYRQTKKDGTLTSFWKRMPYGQLGKCAEALALRKAFPADLSGVYTFEEMAQASNEEAPKIQKVSGELTECKAFETCSIAKIGKHKVVITDPAFDSMLVQLGEREEKSEIEAEVEAKHGPKGKYLELRKVLAINGKPYLEGALEKSVEMVAEAKAAGVPSGAEIFGPKKHKTEAELLDGAELQPEETL